MNVFHSNEKLLSLGYDIVTLAKTMEQKKTPFRLGQSFVLLSLVSACGGGGSGSSGTTTTSGRVFDGYISGARVFRDLNNDLFLNSSESSVLTNDQGYFTGLTGSVDKLIVTDSNNGVAVDTTTGLPFLAKLIAPGDYDVITPITTLVSSLTLNGVSQSEAEGIVLEAMGLNPGMDLSTYDPFNSNDANSLAYKTGAVKIANILMASDGDLGVDTQIGFGSTLNAFSDLLQGAVDSGVVLNLSDVDVLSVLIPNASPSLLTEISEANTPTDYQEIIDEQLLMLSDNAGNSMSVDTIVGGKLIAIEIAGEFNAGDIYTARILNVTNGRSAESSDLVSFGNNVALFRFSNSDLQRLGSGSLELQVSNETTSETFVSEQIVSFTPSGSGGGGGGVVSEPAPTDSGVVADGYISGARVFRDTDEDSEYDAGEAYVLTNASGQFTGLGGDITKPIVADGNNGSAIDTSTGITFNSILAAPAGSKVVNPITTIVNELLLSGDAADLATANSQVANAMGLTSVAGVDFTKFDPISNTTYGDDGSETVDPDTAVFATAAQGVATFVANLIVSGANEKGGDVSNIIATTKSIISSLKDTVKTKSDAGTTFRYNNSDDILSALGEGFNASSGAIEQLSEQFATFNPTNPDTLIDADTLISNQLLSQSEFGDGVLTDAEAANGAVLVIGPTYNADDPATKVAQTGVATIQITNTTQGIILVPYPQVTFTGGKYASIELSNEQLTALGGGTLEVEVKLGNLNASNWDSSEDVIFTTDAGGIYFHQGVEPVITFDTDTVVVEVANGGSLVTSQSTAPFTISGTITVDVGASSLPDGITLRHLVDGLGDNYGGAGRSVALEFINSDGVVKFSTTAEVDPTSDTTNGGNSTGDATFTWTTSITTSLQDEELLEQFNQVVDGDYTIKATFRDAYGATSSANYENLTINRDAPKIYSIGELETGFIDTSVNISDETVVFKINLNEAIGSYNDQLISLKITPEGGGDETTPTLNALSSDVDVSLNSSSDQLTITYTPTGEGSVQLVIADYAFVDAVGNRYLSSDNTINFEDYVISYDLVAPSVAGITIVEGITIDDDLTAGDLSTPTTTVNAESSGLVAVFEFDDGVSGFSLQDISVTNIGGVKAATLSNLSAVGGTNNEVWVANVSPRSNLDGNFTIAVANSSYTDGFGNPGSGGTSASISLDTTPAAPFQVLLAEEKAEYGQGDPIIIRVVYDEALAALTNEEINALSSKPSIGLTIGENSRTAELSAISNNVAEFTYTVTNADLTDENGIVVADSITVADLLGDDGNTINTDIGSVADPLNLSGKSVDGGTSGSAVDGYVEGAVIYADNDDDNVGLTVAEVSSTSLVDVTTRTSYSAYFLTDTEHGVSSSGKFVLTGNDDDGWSAYAVTGDGPLKVLLNEAGDTITILINDPNVTTQEAAENKISVNSSSITDKLDPLSGWGATGTFEEAVAGDNGTPAKYILSTTASFSTYTTIALDENDDGEWDYASEFRTYPVVGDSDTILPFGLSSAADTGTLSINQSIIDQLTPISVSVERTETVYALTDVLHGVSQSGNFVLRGNEVDGFVAYEVTGTSAPYETSATADTGTLLITSQTDIDGGAGLSEGDSIAQADATGGFVIYGADGPLVLEGGFDISTNKDFTVRYKAPSDYTVINPISSLIVAGTTDSVTAEEAAAAVYDEVFSQWDGVALDPAISTNLTTIVDADTETPYEIFSNYNSYDRIAQAADIAIEDPSGSTTDVANEVKDALIYQKAAATYALLVDFISNATYAALGAPDETSVVSISDNVFAAISSNLSDLTRSFANIEFADQYTGDNTPKLAEIKTQLAAAFDGLDGMDELKSEFPNIYDLLAESIISINNASASITLELSDEDDIIDASFIGIDALTEIVQVQAVVQANILADIVAYFQDGGTGGLSYEVDETALLGADAEDGYQTEPVGTVVPIRYEVAFDGTAQEQIAFEGDADGIAASFDFIVTRSGSIKTTSSVTYEIQGGVNSSDIAGGQLGGEIFFDVNEKQKTITVTLNNDDLREASETLTVVISDPTDTSMIVEDRASVTIKDDDPSTPEVSFTSSNYSMSEGETEYLDNIEIDYFDANAFFKLEWQGLGGTITATTDGSNSYTEGDFLPFYDMVTGVLRNLEFETPSDGSAVSDASVIFTLTAAEADDGSGRTSSTEFSINFDVHLLPSIDITSLNFVEDTKFAGVATEISGVTISDTDSDYLTVTVDTDLPGQLYSISEAGYSTSNNSTTSVSFSGATASVQDALDNLRFKADAAGDVTLTFSVDDNDSLHDRNDDGSITDARASTSMGSAETIAGSPPTVNQSFEPFVKVGSGFWSGFSGIEVADLDSDNVTVVISGASGKVSMYNLTSSDHGVSEDGLYAYDEENDLAYSVEGSGTKQDPYSVSGERDTGTLTIESNLGTAVGEIGLKVNFKFGDAPSGLSVPAIQVPVPEIEISGTPEYVNDVLGLLQVSISDQESGLIKVTVEDGDVLTPVELTPSYVPVTNAVPDAGGSFEADNSIQENDTEGATQVVEISGIRLFDFDARDTSAAGEVYETPNVIRVVSSEGGDVFFNGQSVFDENGVPIDLIISANNIVSTGNADRPDESLGSIELQFAADQNFTGDAKIRYVVVDPQDSTFVSPVSEITVVVNNVNDAPLVSLSPVPSVYTQGQDAAPIFSNVNVRDIDSNLFKQLKITALIDEERGDEIIAPSEIFGMSRSIDGNTIIYAPTEPNPIPGITSANVSALLSNIKFITTDNNLVGETRQVNITVTDASGAESNSVTKVITLVDINDAPELIMDETHVSEADFTEGDAPGVALSSFGSIEDPEGHNVAKATIYFDAGYKLGQDKIGSATGVTVPTIVSTEFDEATGAFTIEAVSTAGLTATEFNQIMALIYYSNSSNNPRNGAEKVLSIELTDVLGQSSLSNIKTITLIAQNDNPDVFSVVAGNEQLSVSGAQFVNGEDPTPVRIAPNVSVRDVDGNEFASAVITANSSTAIISLSASGEQLKTAYNLTVVPIAATDTSGPGIKIYKGLEDDSNYIGRSNLETILREVVYSNNPTGDFSDGATDTIKIVVVDRDGAPSDEKDGVAVSAFTSSVSLLNSPAVEVKKTTILADSDFVTTGGVVNTDANVLTFNANAAGESLFFTNQMTVDLSTATIRSDGTRYQYEPALTTDKLALSKATHLDLSKLGGSAETTTTVIGLTGNNVIYGSSFADFIDGNGGLDVVKAGSGDDTVVLRILTDNAEFHGGDGSDTLILPKNVSGTVDLSNFAAYAANVIVGDDFENLDARSATSNITLKGNASSNTLQAGAGSDELWLGAGGDIARGGGGQDTFIIDLSANSDGGTILDLTNVDKIQLYDGTSIILAEDVSWQHVESYNEPTDASYTVAVVSNSNGYALNITDADNGVTTVSIGTTLYGSLGKWLQDSDEFTLKPTKNTATVFDNRGPITSPNARIALEADGDGFSYILTGLGNTVTIADADDDNIKLTVTYEGVDVTIGGETPAPEGQAAASVDEINALLKTLTVSGDSRGEGSVTLSMTDGFSPAIKKTIYFETPNSLPTLSIDETGAVLSSIINQKISLADAGVSILIDDSDTLDETEKSLTVSIDVRGGVASYDQDISDGSTQNYFPQFVSFTGGKITIAYDGETEIPAGITWKELLQEISSDINVTRSSVGSSEISISVSDLEGGPSAETVTFDFTPAGLTKPELLTSATAGEGGDLKLNGSQFEAAKLRVFIKDIGAKVGDKIKVTIDVLADGETDPEVREATKLIPALAADPTQVAPYIEFNLRDIVAEDLRNGNFTVDASLLIKNADGNYVDGSTTDLDDPVSFIVDTSAPDTPEVVALNNPEDGVAFLTSGNVTSVTVSGEGEIEHVIVPLRSEDVGAWFDLPTNFDISTVLFGGEFAGAITHDSTYDEETGHYTLDLGDTALGGGVYAVFARDSVGNLSGIDVTSFDYTSGILPSGVFIVDQKLDVSSVGYQFTTENYEQKVSGRKYKFGVDEAGAVELIAKPSGAGTKLPKDISSIKIEVWSDASNTGSEIIGPNIVAEFIRNPAATQGAQWTKIEVAPIYTLTENQFGTHAAGDYLISDVAGGLHEIYLVSGSGTEFDPYVVSETSIELVIDKENEAAFASLSPSASIDRSDLSAALDGDAFYDVRGSGAFVSVSEADYGSLAPALTLDLDGGLSGASGFVGVRISFEDFAGNTVFLDTPGDQVLIDLIADAEDANAVNDGLVTSIVSDDIASGINKLEAKTLKVDLQGLDNDVDARASYILSLEQFGANFRNVIDDELVFEVDGDLVPPTPELWASIFIDETYAEVEKNGSLLKVPSFSNGLYYLDIEGAFLSSLAQSDGTVPPTLGTVSDWKIVGVTEVDGQSFGQYIAHKDWDTWSKKPLERSDIKIYLSDFVVNVHIDGDPQTRIETFTQNITPILQPDGSDDEPIFIINQVFDIAGNTSFRADILSAGGLSDDPMNELRVDVRDASILEGLLLGSGDDTGSSSVDLITNDLKPEMTFSTDEEIISARLIQISHLDANVADRTALAAYDLTISETVDEDGFTYVASLAGASVNLGHGLWAIEVTDVAGNVSVADTSALEDGEGGYDTNQNIVALTDGVFVIDTRGPPDAEISIENIEKDGGYINQYEVSGSITIEVQPGDDNMSDQQEPAYQIAEIIEVAVFDGSGAEVDVAITFDTESDGLQTYTFDAESLIDGSYTLRVSTQDVAGNVTETDYTFVKDVASAVDPVAHISLEGVNTGAQGDLSSDGVLNRSEIGYGNGGEDLDISIELDQASGTHVVSVSVDGFDVWGLPYDLKLGGVATHSFESGVFGITLTGDYVVTQVSDGVYKAHLVTGSGDLEDPYVVDPVGVDLVEYTETNPTGFIRSALLDDVYGDGLAALSSINIMEIINPDKYHQIFDHELKVVVADAAGNLTEHVETFGIDTRIADGADLIVERSIASSPALDLDYWETIETFKDVPGVRIKLTEVNGDNVVPDSVKVNGISTQVVDEGNGIYFVSRASLLDSATGLKAIGYVDVEVDGITTQRAIFDLTTEEHGVSSPGKYVLLEDPVLGVQAFAVSGDGSVDLPYEVADVADTHSLAEDLLAGTNVITYDVIDQHGNVNSFTEYFTSNLDQTDGQYFSVVPTLYTENSGQDTVMRLDVYVTDDALLEYAPDPNAQGQYEYGGISFDLILELPDVIFGNGDYSFMTHTSFFSAEAIFDATSNSIVFGAFSVDEFTQYDTPILSIDFAVGDVSALIGESGSVVLDVAKISETAIFAEDETLGLEYVINIDDLIITPSELTI